MTVPLNIKIPKTWYTNKMAGKDWMSAFLKRNSSLSIRKPEATSLSRATSFNKTNVQEFYADFASSDVTDRPMETVSNEPQPWTPSTPLPTVLSNPHPLTPLDLQPSTSYDTQISTSVDPCECFSSETVRPLPKAGPRKSTINRKRRKTAILTDTPEKENLRKEQETLNKKKAKSVNKKSKVTKRVEKVKKAILQEVNSDSSSDDEYFCLICCEKYSDSDPGEGWIQCNLCKQWAHEKCISNRSCIYFVCNNCDSENDESD